ncbi:MAG: hypothetical protein QOJ13_2506 [Gaiellales bacterium]|jgi:hypothetical protein|nr:hypothetical protein [Gaiellales bacterium]
MNARTLTIFRLYQLFNGIIFTGPVWAVFLLSRGLSLTEFGMVEAALHVGMLAAQIPSGALADALGRRSLLDSPCARARTRHISSTRWHTTTRTRSSRGCWVGSGRCSNSPPPSRSSRAD